jgi:hypothetical protein
MIRLKYNFIIRLMCDFMILKINAPVPEIRKITFFPNKISVLGAHSKVNVQILCDTEQFFSPSIEPTHD